MTDPRGRRAIVAAMLVVVAAIVIAGWVVGRDDAAWRISTDPVPTDGLVWAAGSTVHLSDGQTIDTGGPITAFVVAGDGVFFVSAESEEDVASPNHGGQLKFAAPGRPPIGTGLVAVVPGHDLYASPSGRYLAVLDQSTGVEDEFGTAQPFVVAFDLKTGEQTIDSTLGMGDPDDEDYAGSETEIGLSSVTDESLYVEAMDGNYVFDLSTGEPEKLSGYGPSDPERDDNSDMLSSPGGLWRLELAPGGQVRVVGAQGEEVTPRTDGPRWNLSWWIDDRTVVGTYKSGDKTGRDSVALMTCRVPSGECEVYEETAGIDVVFPLGIGRVNADGQVRLAGPVLQGQ
ncbi:hypothetical protein [Nocardioides sp.]|uniref:hypothetical protein n=1 Tax=Nocardioides sp. TaxID=35761 RepID=UPI002D1CD26F|nr:hypothetical protein [Nocardioides sp.]HXH78204.1 hypothetical protein [Nocardioides sp.]